MPVGTALRERIVVDRGRFDAVIFDLDGVLTDTAELHRRAWKESFDAFLAERAASEGAEFVPFDAVKDYEVHVDGRPRLDGVRTFLASRGITLSEGGPDAPPDATTVHAIGRRKNELFNRLLERGVPRIEPSVELVDRLRRAGFRLACVSSSRNCRPILERADLADSFEVVVDGNDAARLGLAGKPAPDTFLHAADVLGATARRAVVVEDAESGVEAGRNGGFGLVVGRAREGSERRLLDHGADAVTWDLSEIEVQSEDGTSGTAPAELPSALDDFEAIVRRIGDRRPLVFLDYDGTLTPIVERPEDAVMDDDMRAAVERLASVVPVAIVSGRDVETVRSFVRLDGLAYAGDHGFDIVDAKGVGTENEEASRFLPRLDALEGDLRERLHGIAGAQLERKRFSMAVHTRRVAENERPRVESIVRDALASDPELRVTPGKMVFELQPDIPWHKGRALRSLIPLLAPEAPSRSTIAPIYLGDDVTDEDAFREIHEDGIPVIVGTMELPVTMARWRIDDVDGVRKLLVRLATRYGEPPR